MACIPPTILLDALARGLHTLEYCRALASTNKAYWEVFSERESRIFTQLWDDHTFDLKLPIARFFEGLMRQGLVERQWLEELLARVEK